MGDTCRMNRKSTKMKTTILGLITSVQAGIDVTKTASPSNGHVIHRLERQPPHRKNKTPDVAPKQDWLEEEVSAYDLALTYIQFMKNRPILLYPKIICSGCLVVIGMTIANALSQPGAIRDLLRYSSGRFSEFYTVVGVWLVIKVLYYTAKMIYSQVVPNDQVFRKAGTWAVVTGCTSGLGREYALQLASKGMDMILISRNQGSLNKLAEEISDRYSVCVMTHAADFTSDSEEMYDVIKDKLASMDIGVLVNNVGVSCDPQLFHEVPPEQVMNIIRVNMFSLAKMSRFIVPGMAARGRGIVINLASALGKHPTPLLATYGASKRCVDLLTAALDIEYRDKGVFVQSVTPYFISTNMTKNVETGPLIPDAPRFVRNHLSTVGRDGRTYGYWPHAVQGWFIRNLPTPVIRQLMNILKMRSDKLSPPTTQNGKH